MCKSAVVAKSLFILLFISLLLYVGAWFYTSKKIYSFVVESGVKQENISELGFFSFLSSAKKHSIFDFGLVINKAECVRKIGLNHMTFSSDSLMITYNPLRKLLKVTPNYNGFNVLVEKSPVGSVRKPINRVFTCKSNDGGYGFQIKFNDIFVFFKEKFIQNPLVVLKNLKMNYHDNGFVCSIKDNNELSSASMVISPTKMLLDLKIEFSEVIKHSKSSGKQVSYDIDTGDIRFSFLSNGSKYVAKKSKFENPALDIDVDFSFQNKTAFSVIDFAIKKFIVSSHNFNLSLLGDISDFNTLTREFTGKVDISIKDFDDFANFIVNRYILPKESVSPEEYSLILKRFYDLFYKSSDNYFSCAEDKKDGKNKPCKGIKSSIHKDERGNVMFGKQKFPSFFDEYVSISEQAVVIYNKSVVSESNKEEKIITKKDKILTSGVDAKDSDAKDSDAKDSTKKVTPLVSESTSKEVDKFINNDSSSKNEFKTKK